MTTLRNLFVATLLLLATIVSSPAPIYANYNSCASYAAGCSPFIYEEYECPAHGWYEVRCCAIGWCSAWTACWVDDSPGPGPLCGDGPP